MTSYDYSAVISWGVLPYSRASLSYVRELTYSVYLWSPYGIGQSIIHCESIKNKPVQYCP